jgi:hypothetical protein
MFKILNHVELLNTLSSTQGGLRIDPHVQKMLYFRSGTTEAENTNDVECRPVVLFLFVFLYGNTKSLYRSGKIANSDA